MEPGGDRVGHSLVPTSRAIPVSDRARNGTLRELSDRLGEVTHDLRVRVREYRRASGQTPFSYEIGQQPHAQPGPTVIRPEHVEPARHRYPRPGRELLQGQPT